ncbi:hypothetical protein GJ629_13620 [Halapricum sp. CBA1109]|uniref:hypothetical protein n=1 Tax=Halapricum sp. CBA1109 TaxID=2668068 RepID=UPI0012F8EEF0|nr:hypothetical protein [Halapricum sp. CBA1109]MUV90812.1 hypothetical protein [Halapricum sp. CBA1109]
MDDTRRQFIYNEPADGVMATSTTAERTALRALDDEDRSRTGRVFAAARAIAGTEATMADVLGTFARWRSRYHFRPPPETARTVEALCAAAREQGHEVAAASVLDAAVPDDEAAVLARLRGIEQAEALSMRERDQRRDAFLAAATDAGYDLDRQDAVTHRRPPEGPDDEEGVETDEEDDSDIGEEAATAERKLLPAEPAALSERVCAAGHNEVVIDRA